jgi:hypothetical protein
MSLQIKDVNSQLQRLTDQVTINRTSEQEKNKEARHKKVFTIATAVVFGCLLALLGCALALLLVGPTSKFHLRLFDEEQLGNFEASEDAAPGQADNGKQLKQTPLTLEEMLQAEEKVLAEEQHRLAIEVQNTGEKARKMMSMRKHLEEIQKASKKKQQLSTSSKLVEEAPELETLNAKEEPKHAHEDDNNVEVKDALVSEEDHDKQLMEGLADSKKLPDDENSQEITNAGHNAPSPDGKMTLPPLPFQMLDGDDPGYEEVMKRSEYGVFWVCFPSNAIKSYVEKYAPIFNKIATSRKWRMYPFVYLDTTRLDEKYNHHFCDDITKITFGMEKTNDMVSGNQQEAYFLSDGRHPESYFRQEYPPDQDITTSVVEEFLNNVHSGKLRKIVFTKGDL